MITFRRFHFLLATLLITSIFSACAKAQNAIGRGNVKTLYQQHCSSCHGGKLEGGLGPSLISSKKWKTDGSDEALAKVIKDGVLDFGMPGFGSMLSDEEIRSLVIYLRESKHQATVEPNIKHDPKRVYESKYHQFTVKEIFSEKGTLWGVEVVKENEFLVTEKSGALYRYKEDRITEITGIPEVLVLGQGGLLDVAIDPNFPREPWIYLTYTGYGSANKKKLKAGLTQLVRGKIQENQWVENQILFEADLKFYNTKGVHFGSRITFDGDYLFFSIGDRGRQDRAQDLEYPYGKIYRIFKDGTIPEDNPFFSKDNTLSAIWSFGHRNPQGLSLHTLTRDLWASEHGPRGGDEINKIQKGLNYGWPVISHGMNYSGRPLTAITEKEGMETPAHHWTPSIAVCGIDFYSGKLFQNWTNDLFVGGLASKQLHRLRVEQDRVIEDEILFKGIGRVRDVKTWNNHIYVLVNQGERSTLYELIKK